MESEFVWHFLYKTMCIITKKKKKLMVCVWHTLFWKIKNVGHTLPNLDLFYIPLTNGFFTWLQASTNRTIHKLERKRVTNLEILFITNCLEKKI
jgi:hypothetical protein